MKKSKIKAKLKKTKTKLAKTRSKLKSLTGEIEQLRGALAEGKVSRNRTAKATAAIGTGTEETTKSEGSEVEPEKSRAASFDGGGGA